MKDKIKENVIQFPDPNYIEDDIFDPDDLNKFLFREDQYIFRNGEKIIHSNPKLEFEHDLNLTRFLKGKNVSREVRSNNKMFKALTIENNTECDIYIYDLNGELTELKGNVFNPELGNFADNTVSIIYNSFYKSADKKIEKMKDLKEEFYYSIALNEFRYTPLYSKALQCLIWSSDTDLLKRDHAMLLFKNIRTLNKTSVLVLGKNIHFDRLYMIENNKVERIDIKTTTFPVETTRHQLEFRERYGSPTEDVNLSILKNSYISVFKKYEGKTGETVSHTPMDEVYKNNPNMLKNKYFTHKGIKFYIDREIAQNDLLKQNPLIKQYHKKYKEEKSKSDKLEKELKDKETEIEDLIEYKDKYNSLNKVMTDRINHNKKHLKLEEYINENLHKFNYALFSRNQNLILEYHLTRLKLEAQIELQQMKIREAQITKVTSPILLLLKSLLFK